MRRCRAAAAVGLLALAAQAATPVPAQTAASPQAAPASDAGNAAPGIDAEALARCERAVRQALVTQAGPAAEVRFPSAPTVLRSMSSDRQLVLQGEGQRRAAGVVRGFKYSCNFDPTHGEAVGVVIREAAAPPSAPAAPAPIAEPDLSHLSPSDCESAAAMALKQRWPRVSQITFDPTTRSLMQQSDVRAELHGQGRAQPEPGSPVVMHFGFECTIDPREGNVIGMRIR